MPYEAIVLPNETIVIKIYKQKTTTSECLPFGSKFYFKTFNKKHSNGHSFFIKLGIDHHYDRVGNVLIFTKRPYENSGRHYKLGGIMNGDVLTVTLLLY